MNKRKIISPPDGLCRDIDPDWPGANFAAWMVACELSEAEASIALGLTPRMISYLVVGESPRGTKLSPRPGTRMLMTAIAAGYSFEPWGCCAARPIMTKAPGGK